MAVRVHVLRTCDRCGRPIEENGSVPVSQLKEGDVIPVFQRAVLRIVRDEPAQDGTSLQTKVLASFTDTCTTCDNVIERALGMLVRQSSEGEDDEDETPGASPDQPVRKRRARQRRAVTADMPGPTGEASGAPTPSVSHDANGGGAEASEESTPF